MQWELVRLRWRELAPTKATIPLQGGELAWKSTSAAAFSRDDWRRTGAWLLENVLQYSDHAGLIHLPPSELAGTPRVDITGRIHGERAARLESFSRPFLLASFLLVDQPQLRIHDRLVSEQFRNLLLRGVTPSDQVFFGSGSARVPEQTVAEAASIITALWVSRDVLWDKMPIEEQDPVLSWLESLACNPVVDNNWHWFGIMLHGFLEKHDRRWSPHRVQMHFDALEGFYAGDGWFRDGRQFDFYSSWAFQFYPVFWSEWETYDPVGFRETFGRRNDSFLESFSHIFSRRGEMPAWGRSISYRFAASASLSAAFRRTTSPAMDPGFARKLCSGNLLQFIKNPGFLENGLVPLGFHGASGDLVDHYSSVASPYWCAKAFVSLTLPPDHPFWTACASPGFWSDPPGEVGLGPTGMWVKHNAETGHSRLHAPGNGPKDDPRYSSPYFDTADAVYRGRVLHYRAEPSKI